MLRYFPIKARLLLAYRNPELAKLYQWHHENEMPGSMSGPHHAHAWSHITSKYPEQLRDPRSLRLGLAMDGVSPFGMGGHSTPYSIFPVVMTTYNLPPWLATKEGFSWVVMLLPGTQVCQLIEKIHQPNQYFMYMPCLPLTIMIIDCFLYITYILLF